MKASFIVPISTVLVAILISGCEDEDTTPSGSMSSSGAGGMDGASSSSGSGGSSSNSSSSNSSSSNSSSSNSSSSNSSSSSGVGGAGGSGVGGAGGSGVVLPPIVFQCTGLNGGICTMNADGTGKKTLFATGRTPDMNDAGEIFLHDDTYTMQKRFTDGAMVALGEGTSPHWMPDGRIVFQCTALNGGICTMSANGGNRQTLLSSGRSPDMNAAGEVLFHDDTYTVQKRLANGTIQALGEGVSPQWAPGGGIVFQCKFGGGICTMNADGTNRQTRLATGRSPDMNAAGEILFHDDAYTVKKLLSGGTTESLGAGAFPRWTP